MPVPASEREGIASGRGTWIFLLAVLLHGLAYLLILPPWMGEDEPWQFEFVRHVADGQRPQPLRGVTLTQADVDRHPFSQLQVQRRFPGLTMERVAELQGEIMQSMARTHFWQRVDWADPVGDPQSFSQVNQGFTATNQPLGYYLLAGLWLRLVPTGSLEAELYAVRALSLVLYVITCAAALAAARLAFADARLAWLAATVVAWLPIHARQAAIVNNDVLARCVATLAFLLAVRALRGRDGRAEPLLAVVLLGLGFLTKTTAVPICGLGLVVVLGIRLRRLAPRAAIGLAALAVVVGAGGLYYWYNQHNAGVPRSVEQVRDRVEAGLAGDSLRHLWFTSIGRFNWESRYLPGHWYWWIFQVLRALLVLSLVGLVRIRGARLVLAVALLAVGLQFAAIVVRGVAIGRYLIPALPAFGLLYAAGLAALLPRRAWGLAAAVGVAALVLWDALFLWDGLVLNQYVIWRE